jgi:hypothetical protein
MVSQRLIAAACQFLGVFKDGCIVDFSFVLSGCK